jgi:hypothetical protein
MVKEKGAMQNEIAVQFVWQFLGKIKAPAEAGAQSKGEQKMNGSFLSGKACLCPYIRCS